jgi:hypothetical protein
VDFGAFQIALFAAEFPQVDLRLIIDLYGLFDDEGIASLIEHCTPIASVKHYSTPSFLSCFIDRKRTNFGQIDSNMARNLFSSITYNLDLQRIADFKLKPWADRFIMLRSALYQDENRII